MKYYKNTELAKLYHVSEKSVRNWIQSTQEGKLDLELHQEKERFFIANTNKNTDVIEKLVAKGKKYKNTRGYKVVSPTSKFYKLYTPKQIIDIMSNLDIYRESPLQYTYVNSGAKGWDKYTKSLMKQRTPNTLTSTIQLLDLSLEYLDVLLADYESVNVIDIGVGNGLPVRGVLDHFLKKGMLRRYIGVDISKELLDITKENIDTWFKGKVEFEGYVRDINYDRFDDLLVAESFGVGTNATINLVFFLGGTVANFREPSYSLSTIHDSMGKQDLLLFSKKIDTQGARRYFEMAMQGNQEIDLVLRLLNIDESLYTVEQFFDEENMARKVQVRLNVALAVNFQLYGEDRVIEFNKGDTILLWRARHQNSLEVVQQFAVNGFELMQATRSQNQEHLLLISKIKTST